MQNKINQIHTWLLYLMAIFPLIPNSWFNYVLVAFIIVLVTEKIKLKEKIKIDWKSFLINISPFLVIAISCLLSSNHKEAQNVVSHSLSFLIFPIVGLLNANKTTNKSMVYLLFQLSLVVILLYYLYYFNSIEGISNIFKTSYYVSEFRTTCYYIPHLNIHPLYLSNYIIVGIIIALNNIFQKKYWQIGLIIFYLFFLLLLSSKISLILLIVCIFYWLYTKNAFKIKYVLLTTVLILALCYSFESVRIRFEEMYITYTQKDKFLPEGEKGTSSSARNAVYYCDYNLLKTHWIYGVGIGDVKDKLDNCINYYFDSSIDVETENYNTHNYFIFILLGSGILGLVIFLFYLVYLCLKTDKKTIAYFVLIISIGSCFTENFLYRQHGLTFFFFFLYILDYPKNIINKKSKTSE